MTEQKKQEQTITLVVSSVGLFCLLAYTFWHTGGLLARYTDPFIFGYIAAFGIEATIAGMSYRLATLKKNQKQNSFLVFVLVVALMVSALANIEEGYQARYHKALSVSNIWDIDIIQALIGLSATGLISLLVFAISEIVGSDVNAVVGIASRKPAVSKRGEQTGRTETKQEAEQSANDFKQTIYNILKSGKRLGPRPMADEVGCSPATAKKWIDSYQIEHSTNGKH